MTDLRDRLFDRIGVPRDCGWSDDQLMELIDSGLSGNTPTTPADDSIREKRNAEVQDLAWALNCHGADARTGIADDILAGLLVEFFDSIARARLAQDLREHTRDR